MKRLEKEDLIYLFVICILPILLLHKILFTDQIINATDITTQHYWNVLYYEKLSYFDWFSFEWSGMVNFGGDITRVLANYLLPYRYLTHKILPVYLAISWDTVLHIILAGTGTFLYCRNIGLQRFSSFFAAISFIFSAEIITLINAGHIGKICTISWMPIIFLFLEKGLQEKRFFHFVMTAGALAIQFFEMHWQISFYTCLAVAFYFIFRTIWIFVNNRQTKEIGKLCLLGALMVFVFFSASMISFLPTYTWSKTTERAGGMHYEEGMSWSMHPEELITYIVPEFFGLSRKESVSDPGYIDVFYWGRMGFTQTTRYLGVLPLILAVVALAYRRNIYTALFASLAVAVLFMGMGKYTPVYRFMYTYLPGFSTFRVPQMILFVFAFSVSVMAGMGIDWVFYDEGADKSEKIKKIIYGLCGILFFSALLTIYAWIEKDLIFGTFKSLIYRTSRYINDPNLAQTRYFNVLKGAVWFIGTLLMSGMFFFFVKSKKIKRGLLLVGVTIFLITDVWRINYKFISTWDVPNIKENKIINYLKQDGELYRILPLAGTGGEYYYAYHDVPVLFGYSPVVDGKFADIRNSFNLERSVIDFLNVKYLIISKKQFDGQMIPPVGSLIMGKYKVVYNEDPDNIVFMNTKYLKRAWPVHNAIVAVGKERALSAINDERFSPGDFVLLEENAPSGVLRSNIPSSASNVSIVDYSNNEIVVDANMVENGFVVLSELYQEYWKAYEDGEQIKIYPANYAMRAVYLPQGKHTVRFVFEPWPYKVGLWISGITFLSLVACIMWRISENATLQPVPVVASEKSKNRRKRKS